MRLLVAILALGALLLASPAEARISLPSIKNRLIELALDQVSSPGSFEITVESIVDLEEGVTSLVDVRVSDNEGVWMTAERLNFAWRPSRLLAGELAITQLELIGLEVMRLPDEEAEPPELKPQEPWSQGLFDWPRAPINVSVQGLRLERAHIAEGVLPQSIRFEAEGHAIDRGDLQEVELSIVRTDEVEGRIGLLMRRDFAAETVRLDISANEAPGGLVASYVDIPLNAPVRFDLEADGTVDDWRLDLDVVAGQVLEARGQATFDYTERLDIDALFTVTPGPDIPSDLRTVIGEEARLEARIAEQPDGRIEVMEGEISSPALEMTATGALATGPTGASDLEVSLVALAPLADLVEGLAFDRFGFEGRVTGAAGELVAAGDLRLEGLATAAAAVGRLALEGRVEQTAEGARFDLAGSGEGLRLDRVGPEVIGPAELSARGALAGDVLTLEAASLGSEALRLSATGSYDLAASTGELSLELSAPEIGPVAAAYGLAAEGRLGGSAEVSLGPERTVAELSLALEELAMEGVEAARLALSGTVTQAEARTLFDLEGRGEAIRLEGVPPELTREARLTARGRLEEGALDLAELRLEAPLVTASASGTVGLAEAALDLDYELGVPAVAPVAGALGVEAAGRLTAAGQVAGTRAAPRVSGEAEIAEAVLAGQSLGAVSLDYEASFGQVPEGRVALGLSGSWLGDAAARTRFRLDGGTLALSGLEAQLAGAALSGAAQVDMETMLVDGSLDVSAPELGPLADLVGAELAGAASGEVALRAEAGRQDVRAALTGQGLALAGVELAEAEATLAAADVLGTPRLEAELAAGGVAAGPVALETLTASAAGPLAALEFTAEAAGSLREEPLTAALAGRADVSGALVEATLARGELSVGADTVRLERPLELRLGDGTLEAREIRLSLPGGGLLAGEAARRPAGLTGDLAIEDLPLETAGRWTGLPLIEGGLDARATFDTRPGSAEASVTAELRRVIFEGSQAAGRTLDIDITANWDGAQHDLDVALRGDFEEPVRARLSVPLRPRAGALPAIPAAGELDGALTWSGPIGDFWALVPAPGHILEGQAVIDLRLGGTIGAPRISGRAEVNDGQYQNLDLGTILTDLEIGSRVSQDRVLELVLEASDGSGNPVNARATIDVAADPARLDLAATSDEAVLVRRDDVTAAVSTEVSLAGPLDDLALEGRIRVDRAEVRLVNTMPPEVVDLEGIRIRGEPEVEEDGEGEGVISLDLSIVAERDIFVRGRGLDSEWEMDLSVSGTAASPVVTGEIQRIRGQLQLLGRAFQLERGRVVFDGGRQVDPELDVYLEREDHGIRGGLVIEGRASDPELRFTSVPGLPEDEVMPRLLFGQSRQSLTGPQALQLAAGIATLMGGEAGPIDAFREVAGLDVLRIEGESIGEAAVTVGRNIGENVFIGAEQSLAGEGTAVTVEVEVFKGVTMDTEIGPRGGSNIGITLKKDF